MFNSWIFYICLFIVAQIAFLQTFKYITKQSKSIGALTVLIQIISALTASMLILLLWPFSDSTPSLGWRWPSGSEWWMWVSLGLSFILFAINDRLDATTRKNLDITVDTMLHQAYRILFLPLLIIAFALIGWANPFSWSTLVGGIIIVCANMFLILEKGKFQFSKYIVVKLISVIFFAVALVSQIIAVSGFNLPFLVMLSFGVPALFLISIRQATPKTIYQEIKRPQWWIILICGITQAIMCLSLYALNEFSNRMEINAISAVYVLLNVIFAYIFLKERKNLWKKSLAAVVIVACLVLIALKPF